MAEGGQDVFNLSSMRESLVSTEEKLTSVREKLTSTILKHPSIGKGEQIARFTVLSWNIFGQTHQGYAGCRSHLVPRVLKESGADVLLLQETKQKSIELKPSYKDLCVGKEDVRVLYDSDIFEKHEDCEVSLLNWEKMQQGKKMKKEGKKMQEEGEEMQEEGEETQEEWEEMQEEGEEMQEGEEIQEEWEEMQEKGKKMRQEGKRMQKKGKKLQEDAKKIAKRMVAFRLKHRSTGKKIVFMSFHNIRMAGDVLKAKRTKEFCQVVSETAVNEHALVVAGTDLNCEVHSLKLFDAPECFCGMVRVPEYTMTQRRQKQGKKRIDYFVSAWPDNITVEDHVSVLDPPKFSTHDVTKCPCEVCHDHDPLLYKLSVSSVQVPFP